MKLMASQGMLVVVNASAELWRCFCKKVFAAETWEYMKRERSSCFKALVLEQAGIHAVLGSLRRTRTCFPPSWISGWEVIRQKGWWWGESAEFALNPLDTIKSFKVCHVHTNFCRKTFPSLALHAIPACQNSSWNSRARWQGCAGWWGLALWCQGARGSFGSLVPSCQPASLIHGHYHSLSGQCISFWVCARAWLWGQPPPCFAAGSGSEPSVPCSMLEQHRELKLGIPGSGTAFPILAVPLLSACARVFPALCLCRWCPLWRGWDLVRAWNTWGMQITAHPMLGLLPCSQDALLWMELLWVISSGKVFALSSYTNRFYPAFFRDGGAARTWSLS